MNTQLVFQFLVSNSKKPAIFFSGKIPEPPDPLAWILLVPRQKKRLGSFTQTPETAPRAGPLPQGHSPPACSLTGSARGDGAGGGQRRRTTPPQPPAERPQARQVLTRGAEPVMLCRLWVPTPPPPALLPSARCVFLKPHREWRAPA